MSVACLPDLLYQGTILTANIVTQGNWHYDYAQNDWTYTPGSSSPDVQMTVAATTYEITLRYNAAEIFQMKKDAIANDPECAPCENPSYQNDWCNQPWKCQELSCMVAEGAYTWAEMEANPSICGTDSWGEPCTWCSAWYGSGSYLNHYQRMRKAPTGGAEKGDIVAEVMYRRDVNAWSSDNSTYVIQCIETTGEDATDSTATWVPKDDATAVACGVAIGEWLTAVPEYDYSYMMGSEDYIGEVVEIRRASSVIVTTEQLLPRENYWSTDIRLNGTVTALPQGWDGSATIDLDGMNLRYNTWKSFPGRVTAQPTGETNVTFTLRETVKHTDTIHGLKCIQNCIDPAKMGTSANPPQNKSVVRKYTCGAYEDCSAPVEEWGGSSEPTKVKMTNFSFFEYSWQAGEGLLACEASAERRARRLSEGDFSMYAPEDCTANVAVPPGTPLEQTCYEDYYSPGGQYCYSNSWQIKSILTRGDVSIKDFRCADEADGSSPSPPPSGPSTPEACLTIQDDNWNTKANVDHLDEYYEFVTSVPQEWGSTETVWLESTEEGEGVIRLEPPMTISLKVPEDDHSSLSGVSYAGKTVVLQYSDGIDIYNSPGFPMWCLNRESGNLKEPFVDEWGYTSCVNWTKYEQDCMSMSYGSPGGTYQYDAGMSGGGGSDSCDYSVFNYELFPDILPEIHWEGHDNMNRKWGLKPREKTVVYTKIGAGNCTQSFTNPLADDIDDGYTAQRELEKKGATFRQEVASLLDWYRANKERDELVRVHTGKLVGEAALLAEQKRGSASSESGSG